jgi:polyferredoxin
MSALPVRTDPVPMPTERPKKKKLLRRAIPEHSQRLRRVVQVLFALLNVWIGVEFYLFVRFYEQGGGWFVARPPGVEGWLPIASLMNLKFFLVTGHVPPAHAAGMFIISSFIVISFLFRKTFCSWLCPVGTFSEYLWKLGRQTFRRNWALPRWADIPLRSLKYILMGLFLWVILRMGPVEIRAFLDGPYGTISDVKMLNFFRFLSVTSAVVIGLLVLLSVFIQNFWCRYLCPYGALMGLFSLFSPSKIQRDPEPCIDCGKCAKACPSLLPVDKLVQIRSAECTGCLECVAVCPAEGALQMSTPGVKRVPAWALAAGIAVVFFSMVGYAQWQGYWRTDMPSHVYESLIPRASEFSHP